MKYEDKPFILFLDEINQASIQTLHALFYVVNDRTVAGVKLPNMRIVAAGNTLKENEFLTPLPAPLLDRFVYKLTWKPDMEATYKHLLEKYAHMGATIQTFINSVKKTWVDNVTPRHIEQMIMLLQDGTDTVEKGRELVGAAYEDYLQALQAGERHIEDDRLNQLKEIARKLKLNKGYYIDPVTKKYKRHDTAEEELLAGLTAEERELVKNVA